MWSKGQIWSLDMIFGMLALVSVLLVVLATNTTVDERIILKEEAFYQESVAQAVAQNLVGTGDYWYLVSENFTSVGLAPTPNVLDANRVTTFFSADYDEIKEAFSMGRWELRARLYDKDGVLLNTFGQAPASDSKVKIVNRLAMYGDEPARLRVEVWE